MPTAKGGDGEDDQALHEHETSSILSSQQTERLGEAVRAEAGGCDMLRQ